ncbi:MAG: PhzF family phenazine biosynthesis isomerase [Zhongshania sp.]|uniref:PhzF family phenazine biosynthesis protein n=1 Tax=Zhongshania sp. TaxID=1971902 RepID=UPI002605756C|nr:PhzF family phenazine biosynthesis isomerase [Zhongshania sp.]MDF1694138.1 PhzF family phenazine biosynthesis isomerase [Zhongshania sp.]
MKYYVVDAFSSERFAGNPAAVCLLEGEMSDAEMQSLAAEFNLSETTYLRLLPDGRYSLRWFTPLTEVNLCGHATLAAAHVLWQQCAIASTALRFETRSGELAASLLADGIALEFPLVVTQPLADDTQLRGVADNILATCRAGEDLLIELADVATVQSFIPDLAAVSALPARGLIVTAKTGGGGGNQVDFVSRFFAPAAGIDEDPVTGSAHCALAHYWSQKLGRETMRGRQLSTRGGEVGVAIAGDKVILSGQAVTVMGGEIF